MTENILLQAVLGSKAYGLSTEHSDTDMLGVFAASSLDMLGLDWHSNKETWTNASPEGDDLTLHEIGKFCRLCLKVNPTMIELLYADEYTLQTTTGEKLVSLRYDFLSSDAIRSAYYGYCTSNLTSIQRCIKENKLDSLYKKSRHTLRLARQGVSLLRTGDMSLDVGEPTEYFNLKQLSNDDLLLKLAGEMTAIKVIDSPLPEQPNRDKVAKFLRKVRKEYI